MAAERSRRRPRSTPKAPGTPPGTGSDVGPEAPLAGQAPDASTEAMRTFMAWTASSPEFMQMYLRYLGESAELWRRQIASEPIGGQTAPAPSAAEDRRFSAPEWSSSPYFDFLRQSYLLTSRFLTTAVEVADVPDDGKGQLRFLARQYIDAVAPSNFVATNPEAIRAAIDSNGETVRRGVTQFMEDMARGRISTVDESAFEVGHNLALTPGDVVYENALFQLVQYRAATPRVHERPLLMVPPCINKFYILDLAPDSSFVEHAVASGHTVFIVSWRNPARGEPVDLGSIGAPTYLLATREDHIVPWRSAFASAELLAPAARRRRVTRNGARPKGSVAPPRFVLGASGHIAGIVNPASKNKRSYRVGTDVPADAEAWLAASEEKPGSWWNDWMVWLGQYGGPLRTAPRHTGNRQHPPIEPAPGRYVLQKAD